MRRRRLSAALVALVAVVAAATSAAIGGGSATAASGTSSTVRPATTSAPLSASLNAVTKKVLVQSIASGTGSTSKVTIRYANSNHYLNISVTTGALASTQCVTGYFDWKAKGHHDSRAVRNCKSNSTFAHTFGDDHPSNITSGVNKAGACYGPLNQGTQCAMTVGTTRITMIWSPWPNPASSEPCSLDWWQQSSTGVSKHFTDTHTQNSGYADSKKKTC